MNRALFAVVAALGLLAAGCGDDGGDGANPDGPGDGPSPDADVDAPPEATFTSFVIELVTSGTSDTTDPRAFTDFSDLDDPDRDNAGAYDPLFP